MRNWLHGVLAAIILIVANSQCVQACVWDLKDSPRESSQAPPCHEHGSPNNEESEPGCAHSTVVAEERTQLLLGDRLLLLAHAAEALPASAIAVSNPRELRYEKSPPKPPELLRTTVLRV